MRYQDTLAVLLVALSSFADAMPKNNKLKNDNITVSSLNSTASASDYSSPSFSLEDLPSATASVIVSSSSEDKSATISSYNSSFSSSPKPTLVLSSCTPKFLTTNTSSVYYTSTIIYKPMTTHFPTVKLVQGCTRSEASSTSSAENALPTCDDKGTDVC